MKVALETGLEMRYDDLGHTAAIFRAGVDYCEWHTPLKSQMIIFCGQLGETCVFCAES